MRRATKLSMASGMTALLMLTTVRLGLGFGTVGPDVPLLDQNSEHERITRAALADWGPNSLDEIAGVTFSIKSMKEGTFGAVGAPDWPKRGLGKVLAAHCDGGDHLASPPAPSTPRYPQQKDDARLKLINCRNWIIDAIEGAVAAAKDLKTPTADNTALKCKFEGSEESIKSEQPKCTVLAHLGIAFHAAQDFYSHTNWVDEAKLEPLSAHNPRGLKNVGRAPWLDPRRSLEFPDGLISGCYEGFPEFSHCNYGPSGELRRVKHEFLNKDRGFFVKGGNPIGKTPRGEVNGNFGRAFHAAVDDTADKWMYFKERVIKQYRQPQADKIICVIQRDDYSECP